MSEPEPKKNTEVDSLKEQQRPESHRLATEKTKQNETSLQAQGSIG